jgi:hypothetical protein
MPLCNQYFIFTIYSVIGEYQIGRHENSIHNKGKYLLIYNIFVCEITMDVARCISSLNIMAG